MPMYCYSAGFRWSWLTHSESPYDRKYIEFQRRGKVAFWFHRPFPRKVLMYEEDFSKYGLDNSVVWQPLRDLWTFWTKGRR